MTAALWATAGLNVGLARLWMAVSADLSSVVTGGGPSSPVIGRLRARDQQEWERLFEVEMPAVYRYALARLGNAEEAEDAASAVFAEAYESADHLEDRGLPPRAWLFGIARHVVGTRRRQLVRKPPELDLQAFDGVDEAPRLGAEMLDLGRAVGNLSRRHAEVVMLRFVHGLSLQETAGVLHISVDSVKGRQARALSELREALLK